MTITISPQAANDLDKEMEAVEPTRHPDPDDALDFMGLVSPFFGQGY